MGVNLYYSDFLAVRKVSFFAPANEITAIIGPSGCGKSTLLRSLNRINDLIPGFRIEGSIVVDGVDINAAGQDVIQMRRRIGMLFQRPNPFPMTIYDNITYGLRLEGGRHTKQQLDEIVERSLRRAALWDEVKDRLRRSALGMSGGQQQRLCLARAIAVEPEIILMDEPCSALDPIATLRIEELMRELRDTVTIIIVTHNMQQATRVSDHTAFMLMGEGRAGELIEYGPTEELFNRPRDRRTEDYITGRFG
ncbi:MAG TPA: phosphate ABC transporter ATP-binding protein PstB [Candidatus Dormibacteraeota bacterium]|nr:phosphate ABC transporter ATP-binding protein PstB [Candidatus Dormibacteraeota bacterium]